MQRKYEVRSVQTLDTLSRVQKNGAEKLGILIRHSDRYFSDDAELEPFMGLTDDGKSFAEEFGRSMNGSPAPKLCSSFFGRCIETAYLIDKGYTQTHQTQVAHNNTHVTLAPFYIRHIVNAISLVEKQGTLTFLRNWFDRKIDTSVMEDPEESADRLCRFMFDRMADLPADTMSVCVSHDWNIFLIKEFKMNLPHETQGEVGYLDGLVFYEKQGQKFVVNYQSDPIRLE